MLPCLYREETERVQKLRRSLAEIALSEDEFLQSWVWAGGDGIRRGSSRLLRCERRAALQRGRSFGLGYLLRAARLPFSCHRHRVSKQLGAQRRGVRRLCNGVLTFEELRSGVGRKRSAVLFRSGARLLRVLPVFRAGGLVGVGDRFLDLAGGSTPVEVRFWNLGPCPREALWPIGR